MGDVFIPMKPDKQSGSILIVALMILAVLGLEFGFLAKEVMRFQRTQFYRYAALKAGYQAQSGFVFAQAHWQEVPLIADSSNKEALYVQLKQGFKPLADRDIFLVKSSRAVYSAGFFNTTYRALYKRAYTMAGTQLVWGPLEKL